MKPPTERANILAVDDNPSKLLALSAILAELNQNVVTASSGREALRFLLHQEFAVVLLDVNMPGMDGFETASLIRQREASEHTPIIFVTSFPDDTHAARGYGLGAGDYTLSAVQADVLKTKVSVFVELYKKTAQVSQQALTLEWRARQQQRLTQASMAINSALSPDQMLQAVADIARDLLGAGQAVTVPAPDQKWSAARKAASLSLDHQGFGERTIFAETPELLAFLSTAPAVQRSARGQAAANVSSDWPERAGWLAAPLAGRDGRNMGLLHLLDKLDGDFTEED